MIRTQIIIVRHGQTQWNTRKIRQGHLDSELTDKGVAKRELWVKDSRGKVLRRSIAATWDGLCTRRA